MARSGGPHVPAFRDPDRFWDAILNRQDTPVRLRISRPGLRRKAASRGLETVRGFPKFPDREVPISGLPRAPAGVRRLLVSILLDGGCGYEDALRLRSPVAVEHRLRPPLRSYQ